MNRKTYRGRGLSAARIVSWCAVIALTLCGILIAPQIAEAAAAFPGYASEGLTPRGTTLNLFDYWIAENRSDRDDSDPTGYGRTETGINDGKSLKFRKSGSGFPGTGSGEVNAYTDSWAPNQGIVARNLVNGYPVLSGDKATVENESLDYLFDGSEQAGKEAFMNVGGLLTVDQDGYYVYDSTNNYAEFDEGESHFWLYDQPAVQGSGNTSTGQFFPFNDGNDVFDRWYGGLSAKDINGDNSVLNHYFGVSMTTNFVQQYGGHTDSSRNQAVTYNFSGDDDVWVFIDGVLVGDVGGIHGRASLEIDFASGEVVVYNDEDGDNTYDGGRQGEDTAQETTIRQQFELAGASTSGFDGDTFADDTYHTLSFFYLERGNSASNMALKYNLVTVPTTDIVKVDQDTEYLAGAQFDVLTADGSQICHAVTIDNGGIVLLDENNKPITLDDIWGDYSGQASGNQLDLIFRETVVPAGYRSVVDRTGAGNFDIPMYIQHYAAGATQGTEDVNLLLSRNPWSTGAYAQAKVTATIGNEGVRIANRTLTEDDLINGRLFAIVEKRVNGEWVPVYGDALTGWHIGNGSAESIIEAGRTANAVFAPASSGAWETELADLPGRIQDYIFFAGNQDGQYRGAYYYSDVASWEAMDADSLHRVTNSDTFGRRFSAHVYIANINNRVLLQKVDESGTPQTGATMALYRADDVTIGEDGQLTINQGTQPYRTGMTRNLTKAEDKINVDGAVVFDKLVNGTYYAVETEAPDGFVKTDDYSVVYVTDDGVFADAGTADDDISVTRGVGRVVGSLKQFATNDAIDTTLYNITATPAVATIENGQLVSTSPTGEDAFHLIYNGAAEDVLDYVARDEGGNIALTVEQGIPYLQIAQCAEHKGSLAQDVNDGDITNLFTGSTLVTFRNERRASLEVEKRLEKDEALVGPSADAKYQMDVEFTFPDGIIVDDLTIMANVFDADGTATGEAFEVGLNRTGLPWQEPTYSCGQAITAGQTVRFYGLPDGTEYTVTEDTSGEHALPAGVILASITNANNEEDTEEPIVAEGTIDASQEAPSHVTVTNRYDASATLEGDNQLRVTKRVAGTTFDDNLTFNFTLKLERAVGTDNATDVSDGLTVEQGGSMVAMPENGVSISVTGDNASAESGQKSGVFGNMTFTKAGTYTFSVDETGDAPQYWTYDGSVKTITVSVADDGNGTMTVTPQGNNPTFLNTYYNTDEAKSAETQQGGVVVDETGSIAGVGDTIHYEIRWTNNAVDENGVPCSADVRITDAIPQGTQLVDDSIGSDPEATSTQNNDGTITWTFEDREPGATGTVSFDVTVLAEAAGGNVVNDPTVLVNSVDVEANSTTTVIPGKDSAIGDDDTDGLQVGDVLTYTITYQNTTGETVKMVIEDTLPDGVTFIAPEDGEGWSDNGDTGFTFTYDGQNLTWTADQAAESARGTISFQVRVNEQATSVKIGNTAYVTVGNHTYSTNTTTDSTTGDGTLTVKKVVVDQSGDGIDTDKAFNFTITLTDAAGNLLTGAYDATVHASNGTDYALKIGNDGVAGAQNAFELKHDETIEITGLPEGAHYMVAETLEVNGKDKGYSQAVTEGAQNGTIPVGEDNASVTFTNTYNPDSETFDIDGETGVAVTKRVVGNGGSLSAAGYTFNLNIVNDATHDETGISSGASQNGKTSDANGFVAFDDVTFTQVGIYTVTVEEVVPQVGDPAYNEHMTYDRHTLSYQIQVTNGDGELIAEVVDGTITEGENVFTNFFYDEEDAKHAQNESGALIDGKLVGVGETITYSIDWVNTAIDPQTGLPARGTVTVTDKLPIGVEPVADTLGNGQYDADEHTITWTIDANAAQADTITFDVTVLPEAAGTTLINTAQVNGVTTNSVTNVVPGKQETTDPDQIGEGTVLTYEITFTNTEGNDATATVVDTLTKGQEYNAGSATVSVNNGEAVPAEPQKTGAAEDGETLTWNLSDLSENAMVTITFSVTVTRDAAATVDNTASVNGHNTNTTITPYPTDSKKDVFEADEPTVSVGGKMVSVGDELVYEIDWAADGDGSMTITDTLPAGVEITTDDVTGEATNISDNGSYDSASRTVTWTIGQVAEGDKGTVSFHVVVTGEGVDAETGEIENEATIQIGEGNPQHVFVPVQIPTKQETGSDSADGLQVGDVLEFTIRYANTTDDRATVTVEDTLPAGLTYVADSAAPSDGFTHEGQKLTWVINEVAAGAEGTVSFSARVNENATTVENPADNTAYVTVGDNIYTTNTTHGGDKPATGDLTISKTVVATQGASIDASKEFEFTITATDAKGNALAGTYKVTGVEGTDSITFEGGKATLSLTHDESATIAGLPEGAQYTVTESDAGAGYEQTAPVDGEGAVIEDVTGTIPTGDENASIAFENTYTPGGDEFDPTDVDLGLDVKKVMAGNGDDARMSPEGYTFTMAVANNDSDHASEGFTVAGNKTTDESDGNGDVEFGNITFTQVGTYTVTIVENKPADATDENAAMPGFQVGNVTYDEHVFTYQVRVSDDNHDGALEAEVVGGSISGAPTFTNVYFNTDDAKSAVSEDGDGDVTSQDGTKAMVGDTITYTISWVNSAVDGSGAPTRADVTVHDRIPTGTTLVEGSISEGGVVQNGVITWTFANQEPGASDSVSFQVTVDEGAAGTTVENAAWFNNKPNVTTNTVQTQVGAGDLTVSKAIELVEGQGTEIDQTKLFEFTLSLKDRSGNDLTADYAIEGAYDAEGNELTTVTNGSTFYLHHGDEATISALPAGAVAVVDETDILNDGYSQRQPANGVPGTDGIEAGKTANISFVNLYNADSSTVEEGTDKAFNLTKQFTGRDGNAWLEGDQFTFTLTAGSAYTLDDAADGKLDTPLTGVTVPMPADATDGAKTIVVGDDEEANADGIASIDFGAIKYERAGVYTYTVQEVGADGALGTGGEANGITYDGRTVKITVTVNDYGEGKLVAAVAKTDEADGASFVNTYDSTVHYGADGNGGLEITKQLNNRDMTAGQFTMTVTAADDDSAKKIGGQTVELKSAAAAANTAAPVTSSPFDNVTFNLADAGKTFTYTIAETGTAPAGYQFDTNVYTVSITPRDNGDGTMTVSTQVSSEGGYNEMTEGVATVPFVNTYDPDQTTVGANGSATIVAHKTLENDDIANYEGAFTFKVTDGNTVVATGTNDAAGNIAFSDIAYTSEGLYKATHGGSDVIGTAIKTTDEATGNEVYTFKYAVSEDALSGDNGVSYVSGNGGVTVVVTDDHSGKLSAEVVYDNDAQGIEFVNAYGTGADGATTLTLAGSKKLVGVDGAQPPALKAGQFNFSIVGNAATDGTRAPMPASTTASNAQSGAVSFGPITYTMENVFGAETSATDESATNEGIETYTEGRTKVFTYTVTENQGGEVVDGITYDDSDQIIEVTVTDEGNGKISASVTDVSDEAKGNDDFTFTNTYTVTPEKSTPTGDGGLTFTKKLDTQSGTRQLAEGDFTFQLADAKGTVVATGKNDADGNVAMGAITFTQEGDYSYKLTEVVPEGATPNADGSYTLNGVTYRPAQYTVTAHVVDNHNGTLTVTWNMTNADNDAVTTAQFVNVYNVDPTTVTFGAAKALEGREIAEGEFEFELKDAQGDVVATATNDADGAVTFEPQTFGDAGTYEFTISEVQGDAEGVTYDTTVYDVVLTLVDNGKGGLEVTELTYNGAAALPVFTNTYTEPPAPVEPDEVIPATGDAAVAAVAATVAIGGTLVAAGYVTSKKRGE
ncbi:MAG TPA: DUF11 domain-containing protein [Candidatus Coprousia avicola]|nr:DUF11 domain-containing protein [Candidatus Coprousia avicola]